MTMITRDLAAIDDAELVEELSMLTTQTARMSRPCAVRSVPCRAWSM